jgi:dihydropteroate synthase
MTPRIMGILNTTPDSFYANSRVQGPSALERAQQMVTEGADIIDIGGESTRPGATPITPEQECDRVIPLITDLQKTINIPLSIDSRHPQVIEQALKAGASIVNDISGLSDPKIIALVAKYQVPVCLMHMQGTPASMQVNPTYENVLQDIYGFFVERIRNAEKAGVKRCNIWIDPGFGFGKKLDHNLHLLKNLSFFKTLDCPILVGLSRKFMFGELLNKPPEQRLYGSLAATTIALLQGASIIRTHDVAATKDCMIVAQSVSA